MENEKGPFWNLEFIGAHLCHVSIPSLKVERRQDFNNKQFKSGQTDYMEEFTNPDAGKRRLTESKVRGNRRQERG